MTIETSAAYSWGIWVPLAKRTPSEPQSLTKMGYKKFPSWGCSIAKTHWEKQIANGRN